MSEHFLVEKFLLLSALGARVRRRGRLAAFLELGKVLVGDSAAIWLFRVAGLAAGIALTLPVARESAGITARSARASRSFSSTPGRRSIRSYRP
jgi:hypothetical protein